MSRQEQAHLDQIGPYRILDVLGEGGMGTVYLAEQREPLRRRVALKVIKLGMDTREVLRRFEAERQALAMMEHDSIARVLDAGATESGRPYFAMEYVKGVPLTRYCDEQSLSLEERLGLFQQVCSGVQHAHHKGVIHRDLKPGNVLVTLQDGTPRAKIIDFGLARATDHQLVAATLFTEQGATIGTPEYMSPEQAGLGGLDIDTRSDVYALGVMLYELLVGELPFSSAELRRAGLLEIHRKIREDDPPRPSTRLSGLGESAAEAARLRRTDKPELLRALRGDLDWVVMKAIEKDRSRRYETVSGLAQDLRRHLQHEPVLASPPSVRYRMRKFLRRYRVLVVAAGLVLVTLLAGLVAFAIQKAEVEARNRELEAFVYADLLRRARSEIDAGRRAGLAGELDAVDEERRCIAWRYLRHRAELSPLRIEPEPGDRRMRSVEISPDGRRLLTVTVKDGGSRVDVRQIASGRKLRTLAKPGYDAAWSPDGSRILSGARFGKKGELVLWDARTGQELASAEHGRPVRVVCFSRDGARVASADWAGGIRIARTKDLRETRRFEFFKQINALQWSPDDTRILVAGFKSHAELRDAKSGEVLQEYRFTEDSDGNIRAASFSPDGSLVLLTGTGGRVALWRTEDGTLARELQPHQQSNSTKWISSGAAFSPDGKWAMTGGLDLRLRLHSVETGHTAVVLGTERPTHDLDASASWIVSGGSGGQACIWRLADLALPVDLAGHDGRIEDLRSTPDGRFAWSVGRDAVRKWELRTGRQVYAIRDRGMASVSMDLSPDGAELAVGGIFGPGKILDASTGRVLRRFEAPDGAIPASRTGAAVGMLRVRYSPDGRLLAAAVGTWDVERDRGRELPVLLFDARSGRHLATLSGHRATISGLAFSPDGRRLASAGYDRKGFLWDVAERRLLSVLPVPQETATQCMRFDPTGRWLCIGFFDGSVRAYDAQSGEPSWVVPTGQGLIMSIDFDARGERMLVVGNQGGSSVWELPYRNRLLTVDSGNTGCLGGHGSSILVGSTEGLVRCFDVEPEAEWFGMRHNAKQAALRVRGLLEEHPILADARRALDEDPALNEEALRLARDILETTTEDAGVLNEKAWRAVVAEDSGRQDRERALRYARTAVAAADAGSLDEAMYVDTLGAALYRAGRHAEAVAALEKSDALVRRHPDWSSGSAGTHALLALAHSALGDEQRARSELELAWRIGPRVVPELRLIAEARRRLGIRRRAAAAPYSAGKATGPPDAARQADHPNAWAPSKADAGLEWLELGYPEAMRVAKIRIYEVAVPGAVAEIVAIHEGGARDTVWKGSDPTRLPGVFQVEVPANDRKLKGLRIVLDTSRRPGWNEIDTVEIVAPDGRRQWPSSARACSVWKR